MKNLWLFVLLPVFICGCKKEKNNTRNIAGYYKTVSMISDKPADLNNDGVKSANLYAEITAPLYGQGGPPVSFYDFNQFSSFVEVRPLPDQSSPAKLIAFNFPNQVFLDSTNNSQHILFGYFTEFNSYTYEIDNDDRITLTNFNSGYEDKYGMLHSLELKQEGGLILRLTKKIYCFAEQQWIAAEVTVEYEKVR